MSYDRDHNDDKYSSKDSGSSSSRSGKGKGFDDAPGFDATKLVDEKGLVFGIHVNKSVADQINNFGPALLDYVRRAGEKIVGPAAERMAQQAGHSEAEVARIGGHARDVTGYGIIFLNPILGITSNVYQAGKTTSELAGALKPLGREGWESGSVQQVKKRTKSVFMQNLTKSLATVVGSLPAFYSKVSERGIEREKQDRLNRLREAEKDPQKYAEFLMEENSGAHGAKGVVDKQRAVAIIADKEEAAMRNEFFGSKEKGVKGWSESAEAEDVRKKVKKAFGTLPETWTEFNNWSELKRYGVDVDRWKGKLSQAPSAPAGGGDVTNPRTSHRVPTDAELWRQFRNDHSGKNLKKLQEQEVKRVFAEKKGMMPDRYWIDTNPDKIPTVRDKITKDTEETLKQLREAEKSEKAALVKEGKEPNQIGTMFAGIAAGIASGWLSDVLVGQDAIEKNKQPLAWDYFNDLQTAQKKALKTGENMPDEAPLSKERAEALREAVRLRGEDAPKGGISYGLVIHEALQRYKITSGETPIHKHDFQHLADAGWDIKKFEKETPEEERTAYESALVRMSRLVQSGEMPAIALNLLISHPGYDITAVLGGDTEKAKKAVNDRIDAVMVRYRQHDELDEAKATQARGGIVITDEELRAAFGPGGLKGDQRAFTFMLLESVVQNKKKLCEITGMSGDQCSALSAECSQRFNKLLDAAVVELADQIKANPEALEQQIKLTDDDKKTITALAGKISESGADLTDAAEGRREALVAVKTVVANAAMAQPKEQVGEERKPGFLERILERAKHPLHTKPKEEEHTKAVHHSSAGDEFKRAMDEDDDGHEHGHEHKKKSEGFASKLKAKGGDGASLDSPYRHKAHGMEDKADEREHDAEDEFGEEKREGKFAHRLAKKQHAHKETGVDLTA